jgi:transposase
MVAVRVSGTVTNDAQRAYIKIEILRGKTRMEIHSSLMEVCGVKAVDRSTISRWAQHFREGRLSIENDPKSGRRRTSTDDQNVERVVQILEEDRRMTCEEIAHSAGISRESAYRILTERLHKSQIAARLVPHDVSEEQKCRRLEIAQQLLHRFRKEGNEFLQNVVAIDETWIRDFEPELKSQSSEWRGKVSPTPKNFKRAHSNVKQMMIFAYDCKGVIMTDRVPSGTTVTAAYYRHFLQNLRRKVHANRTGLLENGVLILHDNARPHLGKDVL